MSIRAEGSIGAGTNLGTIASGTSEGDDDEFSQPLTPQLSVTDAVRKRAVSSKLNRKDRTS